MAGKAYVEQFGLEIFGKADNAVRANKASRQTADTFQASATFLDLLQIWGPVDPEITAKIKYAKYHALRIAKALKAGEDPNLSNPTPEPEPEDALPPLDPNDAEVQALGGGGNRPQQPSVVEVPDDTDRQQRSLARTSSLDESLHPSRDTSVPPRQAQQPTVTEVPDQADHEQSTLAPQSSLDQSLHPSRAPSIPRSATNDVSPITQDATSFYTNTNGQGDVSPVSASTDRKPSIGGNYFPRVPSPTTGSIPDLPSAPPSTYSMDTPLDLPTAPSEPSLPGVPTTLTQPSIPPSAPPQGHFLSQSPPGTGQQPIIPPNFAPQSAPRQPIPQNLPQLRQPYAQPPAPTGPDPAVVVDEEAMMKAQKHARWAISALNFEDVPTAIREFRAALAQLGAP